MSRPETVENISELEQVVANKIHDYEDIFRKNLRNKENALLEELHAETCLLKEQIAMYKRQTAEEAMKTMIVDLQAAKQAERQQLEVHWRALTEQHKTMETQMKQLQNANKEYAFDFHSLEEKIKQLTTCNIELTKKVAALQLHNSSCFFTQQAAREMPQRVFLHTNEENLGILRRKEKLRSVNKRGKLCLQSNPLKATQVLRFCEEGDRLGNRKESSWERGKNEKSELLLEFLSRQDKRDQLFRMLRN